MVDPAACQLGKLLPTSSNTLFTTGGLDIFKTYFSTITKVPTKKFVSKKSVAYFLPLNR